MNIHEFGPVWDAFLRDIVEHPDDDAPRLILADWLEEQGHPTQKARAEFLRLQYEGEDERLEEGRRHRAMQQAGRILEACFPQWWLLDWAPLERYHYRPRRALAPPAQYYNVLVRQIGGLTVLIHGPRGLSATFRRGFVEHLLLPLSVLESHVGQLFTTCPLKRVELTDRHPMDADQLGWCWHCQDAHLAEAGWPDEEETATLPAPIFARLPPRHGDTAFTIDGTRVLQSYGNEAEARDACSRAIVAWGRELLGMPVLKEKRSRPPDSRRP